MWPAIGKGGPIIPPGPLWPNGIAGEPSHGPGPGCMGPPGAHAGMVGGLRFATYGDNRTVRGGMLPGVCCRSARSNHCTSSEVRLYGDYECNPRWKSDQFRVELHSTRHASAVGKWILPSAFPAVHVHQKQGARVREREIERKNEGWEQGTESGLIKTAHIQQATRSPRGHGGWQGEAERGGEGRCAGTAQAVNKQV